MMSNTATNVTPTAFLTIAVATSFVIGGVGYLSGSTPEWIVLKSSIGLLLIGLVGWIASSIINARTSADEEADGAKGANVDVTLPETVPLKTDEQASQTDEHGPQLEADTHRPTVSEPNEADRYFVDSELDEVTVTDVATR